MVSAVQLSPRGREIVIDYWPMGGAAALWKCRDEEVLLDGPAGTGKTRACLQKLHQAAINYPGMRGLMLRKTFEALKGSAMVTFADRIQPELDGAEFFGGSKEKDAGYYYPNGSFIGVGGLDKAQKIMSKEFDMIYVNEAVELTEHEWELCSVRLRYGVMPYQQLIADVNPDVQTHWLNQRCIAGKTTRILSRHKDNPMLWDARRERWTMFGETYIRKLHALTGVRKRRLADGEWCAAEGQVFDEYDTALHLVSDADLDDVQYRSFVAGVDWGYTNPGVIGVFGIDGDKRMVEVFEVYQTGKTMDWWIPKAKAISARYGNLPFVCDPSEPAYIQQFIDAGLNAFAGVNDILPGINAIKQRLTPPDDGRPRLLFHRDALESIDPQLSEDKKPTRLIDELPAYIWAQNAASGRKERPVDADNHGADMLRYAVMHVDGPQPPAWDPNIHGNGNLSRFLAASGVG
jgi:phage terminase large subunit